MPITLYQFALAIAFISGMTIMIQPQRQTRAFMQTLEEIQVAGTEFIGANCDALPETVTTEGLQSSGHLDNDFADQGVRFTWRLAGHPTISINAGGEAAYLAFLGARTLGEFEADSSHTFIPAYDITYYRAANHWYNLFAYAGNDFSCNTP